MKIQSISGLHDETTFIRVDGREYELSRYEGRDDLPCMKCGKSEEYNAEKDECTRGLYTSLDDMFLCSDCLEAADANTKPSLTPTRRGQRHNRGEDDD